MYNTAIRILKDRFEAENIMQESFLTAFSKLGTFKSESRYGNDNVPFGSWLKRIVVNKSLTQLKKNNKFEQWDANKMNNYLNVVEEDADKLNYELLKADVLLPALKELKSNYRVILTLSLIEGFDNEEIASILKISNSLVRTTISRAKTKLKATIAFV